MGFLAGLSLCQMGSIHGENESNQAVVLHGQHLSQAGESRNRRGQRSSVVGRDSSDLRRIQRRIREIQQQNLQSTRPEKHGNSSFSRLG